MEENQSKNWSEELKLLSISKIFIPGINQSAYESMFGRNIPLGLLMSFLLTDLIQHINDENDLLTIVKISTENQNEIANEN